MTKFSLGNRDSVTGGDIVSVASDELVDEVVPKPEIGAYGWIWFATTWRQGIPGDADIKKCELRRSF